MSDVTATLSLLLKQHDARIGEGRTSSADVADEFLKEAYRINAHIRSLHTYLLSVRPSYLSTTLPSRQRSTSRTHLSNPQRDAIDAESKATLRDLNATITQLERVETLRRDTTLQLRNKKSHGGNPLAKRLGKWAAGGVAQHVTLSPEEELQERIDQTLNTHRESVVWFLRRRLEACADVQRGMMETRLEREIEKSKSVLYKTKGASTHGKAGTELRENVYGDSSKKTHDREEPIKAEKGGYNGAGRVAPEDQDRKQIENELSPEQLQLFAQENNDMLKHYEDTLDQVRTAERSMVEISELQTTLAQNLALQSERIDVLVEDAANTEQNVAGGNKQLKRATERWRPAKFVFHATLGLCGFLVVWDLIF